MGKHSVLGLLFAALASASPATAADSSSDSQLDEIIVTATLRPIPLAKLPGSVSVLTEATLRDAGQQHFEDVLALVPNLNWAGDTSRPRYFQIRGIGELQQYQGAPNPSVGLLIDDIDFSGLGTAATLFDVDHIEVLHGPQGTLYGANALAGLIYVKSAAPADTFGGRAEVDAGDYAERSYGAVITGPVAALDSAFRLAVQRYTSDGFYHNAYLGRGDADRRDELTLRGRWRYEPNDQWRVELTLSGTPTGSSLRLTQRLNRPEGVAEAGPGWHWYLERLASTLGEAGPTAAWDDFYTAELRAAYQALI